MEQIQQDWQALEPKDWIVLFEKFLKYTLSTLQSIQNEKYNNKKAILKIIRDPMHDDPINTGNNGHA